MSGGVNTLAYKAYCLVLHKKNVTSGPFLGDKVAREENRPLTPV
jgi:hypothetical protein